MLNTFITTKSRARPRRARSGYSMASLAIVLFLASVLISQFSMRVLRDTQEADALAAFNVTQDRLTRVRMTAGHSSTLLPHMLSDSASILSGISIVQGGTTAAPVFEISTPTYKGLSSQLYLERVRAWLSVAKSDNTSTKISNIALMRIPDPYPERLTRDGLGRMATDITFDAASPSNVSGVNSLKTSFGQANAATAKNFIGLATSDMSIPSATGTSTSGVTTLNTLSVDELKSSAFTASSLTVSGGMKSGSLRATTASTTGTLSVQSLNVASRLDVTRQFAAKTFPANTLVHFGTMTVDGLFADSVKATSITISNNF